MWGANTTPNNIITHEFPSLLRSEWSGEGRGREAFWGGAFYLVPQINLGATKEFQIPFLFLAPPRFERTQKEKGMRRLAALLFFSFYYLIIAYIF